MSYYKDLTPYDYYHSGIIENTFNVGWLSKDKHFEKGLVNNEFIGKICLFLQHRVLRLRGFHICDLCEAAENKPHTVKMDSEIIQLGSSEIRVLGSDGRIYAAPDLIYHYIVDHNYKPPDEFIDAVLHGPEPSSAFYNEQLRSLL